MKKVLTQRNGRLRQPMLPLLVIAALSIPTVALAGDVLFVSDSETDAENIPDVLSGGAPEMDHPSITGAKIREGGTAGFHDVTIIRNDYQVTGGVFGMAEGTNPTLAGDLAGYCSVFWSASGPHEPLGLTPERLNDGSFEDVAMTHVPGTFNYMVVLPGQSALTGWTVEDMPIAWGVNPTDGYSASEGDGFVDLSSIGDTSAGKISQQLATMAGTKYLLSIDRQGDGSIVAIDGTDIALAAGATTGSWTTYTATFVATGPVTTLAIRKDPNDTTGIVFIDNLSFIPQAPIPLGPGADDGNGSLEDVSGTYCCTNSDGYMELFPGDADLTGWTIDERVEWGLATGGILQFPSEGDGLVNLNAGDSAFPPTYVLDGKISKGLATTPGTEYQFSIDRQGDGSIVSVDGTDIALNAGTTTGLWTTYTATFTATAKLTFLSIREEEDTDAAVLIDNMSVLPQAALGPGLGADGGLHDDEDVFDNLITYVGNGGFVFVTGHDAIAHPFDPDLVEFVAGAGAVSGQQSNPSPIYNGVQGFPTAITIGSQPIAGFTPVGGGINPVDNVQEQDYLNMVGGDVTVLVNDFAVGIGPDAAAWTVRHPFGPANDFSFGQIAYVANGVFFYETAQVDEDDNPITETLADGQDDSWLVPNSAYKNALLNFAENACTEPGLPTLDDVYGRGKGTKVNLTWTANGADSYDVFRSDTPGGPYALLGSTANNVYVDSPVVPGNTYYYVVQGVFGVENSADSNEAEVVVPAGRRR